MSDGPNPGSWVGRVVGWCFALLVGAMALEGAVRIVEGIWWQLCIGAAVALAVAGGIALIRRSSRF